MRSVAPHTVSSPRLPLGLLMLGLGSLSLGAALQGVLSTQVTAVTMLSPEAWRQTVQWLGGVVSGPPGQQHAELDMLPLLAGSVVWSLTCWAIGSAWLSRTMGWGRASRCWAFRGWQWCCLPGIWELLRVLAFAINARPLERLLLTTPQFWWALTLAGWLSTFLMLNRQSQSLAGDGVPTRGWLVGVFVSVGIYTLVYTGLNWRLYEGLLVPHGDSAMYEEHLWNLTHGKGFRSYLDQGLFLGEHIQVIHLLLVPLHLIWPSHLLLELCESFALASAALPIFWITRRHTASNRAGLALSIAWLLYAPLQFLDISIDFKTFRPIGFGVPLLLLAIDQWERRHTLSTVVLLCLTLLAKEDYSLVIGAWGGWIFLFDSRNADVVSNGNSSPSFWTTRDRGRLLFGFLLTLFCVAYILWVTQIAIPWFRGGADVHYAPYFQKFGSSSAEVAQTLLTRPWLLIQELSDLKTVLYLVSILTPLACVPLLSPSRFLVAVPLLVLLCLNELSQSPHHHFHAPVLPILFWAAAAGLANTGRLRRMWHRSDQPPQSAQEHQRAIVNRSTLVLTSTLACGLFFSIGPLGIPFWDTGSSYYWKSLYVPGRRSVEFAKVAAQIPLSARVASTDFVHPRFTHHNRSYDYSGYRRRVSNYELRVPADTDYIVIDTQHPYSTIRSLDDIPDYRAHPERWQVLPDTTDGYFLVLKRRTSP